MQIAIISDVHANFPALRAVLTQLQRRAVREILCLGDLVGYSAMPRETLTLLGDLGVRSVHGNHDLMVAGRLTAESCGPIARKAVEWTRSVLNEDERQHLAALPGALRWHDQIVCVHSVLGDTVVRLTAPAQFTEEARALQAHHPPLRVCFTGHTHMQNVVEVTPSGEVVTHTGETVALDPDAFSFVNPGSVGDVFGRDPRAAYAVYDVETREVRFHRLDYDRSTVLRENVRHHLGQPRGGIAAVLRAGAALAEHLIRPAS
jgi:predicted phosphodiesterase